MSEKIEKVIFLSDIPQEDETNRSQEDDLEEIPEEELLPMAVEDIGAPPPATSQLQQKMSALWAAAETEKPPPPRVQAPVLALPDVLPMPLVEKIETEQEVRYLTDFGVYDRKAQWRGVPPTEKEPFFQILCVGHCRKPTWTRSQLEDVCEECYLSMQAILDEGAAKQIGHWSTYSGNIGWYS